MGHIVEGECLDPDPRGEAPKAESASETPPWGCHPSRTGHPPGLILQLTLPGLPRHCLEATEAQVDDASLPLQDSTDV